MTEVKMVSIEIDIEDETYELLTKVADDCHLTVDQLVEHIFREKIVSESMKEHMGA